jgi:hypothetical protein
VASAKYQLKTHASACRICLSAPPRAGGTTIPAARHAQPLSPRAWPRPRDLALAPCPLSGPSPSANFIFLSYSIPGREPPLSRSKRARHAIAPAVGRGGRHVRALPSDATHAELYRAQHFIQRPNRAGLLTLLARILRGASTSAQFESPILHVNDESHGRGGNLPCLAQPIIRLALNELHLSVREGADPGGPGARHSISPLYA